MAGCCMASQSPLAGPGLTIRVVLTYAIASTLYILLSDSAVHALWPDQEDQYRIGIWKGWGFVAVTSLVLWWILRRKDRALAGALAELESSEARWRYALEGAGHGVWEWDTVTDKVFFSRQWKAMLGYDEQEVGDSLAEWESRVHPEDLAATKAALERHFSGAEPVYRSEHRLRCKDGSYKWILDQGKVMSRTAEGKPLRVIGTHTDISGQRRSEQMLRLITDQLGFYLRSSPVVSYSILVEGSAVHPVWISENVIERLGYSVQEALRPDWWRSCVHPEDLEKSRRSFRAALRGPGKLLYDYRFVRKDGGVVWVQDEFSVVRAGKGEGTQIVGALTDITARKALEESLRESEDRFRTVFEQSPLGIAVIDSLDGRILEANPMYAAIVGRSREQLAAIDWQAITHPDDVRADLDNMAELNSGRIPGFNMRKRYLRPDGTAVWVGMTVAPMRQAEGGRRRHLCMVEDITEREKAQRSLLDEEQKFRGLIEQSLVGVFMLGEGRVIYANPRTEEIFGFGPGELQGRAVAAQVAPEDVPAVEREIGLLFAGAKPVAQLDFRGLRADGSTILIGAQGRLAQVDGKSQVIGVLQDITEKRGAEETIRGYVRRLEDAVLGTAAAVSQMVELRDPYTAGHERRVGELSAAIAAEMGMDEKAQRGLRVAGAVHDVGKIMVPAEILAKPARLTAVEFELVKQHAQQGYEVLKGVAFPWPVAEVARQHHERLDGSGYPRGLKGDEIIPEARILAVADVVESMSSHRPYRAGLGMEKALAEVEANSGRLYDAAVVAACLRLFREKGYAIADGGRSG